MKLNLEKFDIRRSDAKIFGNYNLPKNTERYIVKAQGLIGIDIFRHDKIEIINTEGGQICEVIVLIVMEKITNQLLVKK